MSATNYNSILQNILEPSRNYIMYHEHVLHLFPDTIYALSYMEIPLFDHHDSRYSIPLYTKISNLLGEILAIKNEAQTALRNEPRFHALTSSVQCNACVYIPGGAHIKYQSVRNIFLSPCPRVDLISSRGPLPH